MRRLVTDGTLGRVSYFNQLGDLYRESENADDATSAVAAGSTHDRRTISVQRTVAATTSYSLTSNPFLSDGSASETTLGWTLRESDRAGRTTDIYYYRGSAKPSPFGDNSSTPAHEFYRYTGATTTFTDAKQRTRTTTIDALGRTKTASEGGLITAEYDHDVLDNLTSVTMTDSTNYGTNVTKTQTRTFVYSSLGRLVSATNPESGTTSYTYYANGALKTETDARSKTINYAVDGLSRVTKKDYTATDPLTPAARFCYDGKVYASSTDSCGADSTRATDYAQGALTDAVALNGATVISETKYTGIDAQGRVTSSVQKTTGLVDMPFTYQYSATGGLSAVQYPSGRWVSYDLNGANLVKAVRNGQSGSSYYLQQATYKPDGSFAGATVGLDTSNQWTETRGFNSRLQPCTLQVQKGTQTLLLGLQWKHSVDDPDGTCENTATGKGTDNNGNLRAERLQYPSGGVQQTVLRDYGYDGANRITSYTETGKSQAYGYDAFGNMWQSGTATGVPELRPNGPSWYLLSDGTVKNRLNNTIYDAAGHQTQLSASPGTEASYDAEGRLSKVTWSGGGAVVYDYDAEGHRVRRTVGAVTTYFVYDADGQLMAEYSGTTSTAGTQYLVSDNLGSTRLVLDGQGNCVQRMDYAPYGAQVMRSGQTCYTSPASGLPLYTGQMRDSETAVISNETGLDFFNARYYWAVLGRFTSPDPGNAGADPGAPGSWNMYSYGLSNPLSFVDPMGRCSVKAGDTAATDDPGEPCVAPGGTSITVSAGESSKKTDPPREDPSLSRYAQRFYDEMSRRRNASNQMIVVSAGGSTTVGVLGGAAAATGTVVAIVDGVAYTWEQLLALGPQVLARLTAAGKIGQELWFRIKPYLGGGLEISLGKRRPIERVNLTGDWRQIPGRIVQWYERLPHYHRRFPGPGGSIGRHRPWESPGVDKAGNPLSWWKRF